MSFIRQLVEKKVSSATGASVTFGEFKFSPMSGTIEAIQVRVAAERFVAPFLSIERVEAKVAVARALKGEIVIKSLAIERPAFVYAVHSDGKNNLPRRPHGTEAAIVPKEGAAGGSWELEADKISITHGRIEYRDATRNNYTLSLEGINATITPEGSDIGVTITADSLGRLDHHVDLGTVKLLGKLSGGGFHDPLASTFTSRASIADTIVLQITSTFLANHALDVEIGGAIKLATLIGLLPLSPARPWELLGDGDVDVRGKLSIDLFKTIHIEDLQLKLGDVSIHRTFGHHPVG